MTELEVPIYSLSGVTGLVGLKTMKRYVVIFLLLQELLDPYTCKFQLNDYCIFWGVFVIFSLSVVVHHFK